MSEDLLKSPCLFCGYNARGYWQSDTHDTSCVWHGIGGMENRMKLLPLTIKRLQKTNQELLEALGRIIEARKPTKDDYSSSDVFERIDKAITNAKQVMRNNELH